MREFTYNKCSRETSHMRNNEHTRARYSCSYKKQKHTHADQLRQLGKNKEQQF